MLYVCITIATGDWRNAARAYEGLGTTPAARNPVILNNLAYAYSQIGDRRAIPTAEAALKGAPNAPEVKDTLGWLLFSTKADPKRGLALLEQAARGAPRNPTIRYHLGMAYRASGQRAQARTELQAALAAGPFPEANAARQALSTL